MHPIETRTATIWLSRIFAFSAIATLAACKIEIESPVEGGVRSLSGAIECAAGQVCAVEVSDIYFDETFVAEPAQGWHFTGWQRGPRGLCGSSDQPCWLPTHGFEGNDALMAILESPDEVFHLKPRFAVDRHTDGIALAGERSVNRFGMTWEMDFFRNHAYSCGLSGNYTFMVVNPADNPDAEAPLWVYLHGGGSGFFDDNGDYYGVNNQTEDTWNHEETFDDFLHKQLEQRTVENGQLKDITLTRRIEEGYRVVMVSMCDHDQYSGLGTPYPNNPNSGAAVNGMQATMAAVDYTVANYPTTEVFAHGTSAGSVGVYNLAMSFAAEDIHLTGVVADSVVSPRGLTVLEAYSGHPANRRQPGWNFEELSEKIGFYADLDAYAYPEARIDAGFDEVPLLFVGGAEDPFCMAGEPAIPEAAAEDLNNCEWAAQGLIESVAAQPDSPHQVANLPGLGHVPTNDVTVANDIVDTFIRDILADNPSAPFRTTSGYKMMMMGHSFFRPIAQEMPFHAARAGVNSHTQNIESSGGASGAPMALWNDAGHRANIQAVLDSGNVEVFGMTFEPTYPTTEGYELWIDYALAQNPETVFFIALPWPDFPQNYADAAEYSNFWLTAYDDQWLPFIDSIHALYPDVAIYSIPYGQAALELRELYEAGNLPDVSNLTGASSDAIFVDNKGHAGQILLDLAELIWLDAIYDIDLDEYAYDPGYQTDLKAIAKSIMDAHNPAYNGPSR